jgi:Spy/CpxP family protein refolding chaperone
MRVNRTKTMAGRQTLIVLALLLASAIVPRATRAQQAPPSPDAPNVSPAEIQRMFDAYALVQAQDQLKLGEDQFPQFLARFKALQEIRRRSQVERFRALQELTRLSRQEKADETELSDALKNLQEIDTRAAAETKKASDAINQLLDLRQQVRFRLFEELMERRKLELVTRARQNNRLRNRP